MFTSLFWKDALERMIFTLAQALLSSLTVVSAATGGITDVAWGVALSTGALAALISLLKSIIVNGLTKGNSASLVVNNVTETTGR